MRLRYYISLLLLSISLNGTCNYYYASDLTYNVASGSCVTGANYEINLRIFTHKDSLFSLDSALIFFGDGQYGYANKIDSVELCNGYNEFHYKINHQYLACATYNLTFVDSFAIKHATNYPNLQNNYYGIRSIIVGSWFWSDQFSPTTSSKLGVVSALKNQEFRYNSGFYDPDGDSISYQLIQIDSFPNYWIPNGITINPLSGEIVWINPDSVGVFDLYIRILSYRNGIYLGEVLANVSIIVDSLLQTGGFDYTQNWSTNGSGYFEYHLTPFQNLQLFFEYFEPTSDSVDINSNSELYSISSPATFTVLPNGNSKFGLFEWTPDTLQVRNHPYVVTFYGVSYFDTLCSHNIITVMIYVDNNVFVQEINSDTQFNIYPNPTTENVFINITDTKNYSLKIFDVLGKEIYSRNIQNKSEVNVSQWKNGVYIFQISNNEKRWIQKIIKQ